MTEVRNEKKIKRMQNLNFMMVLISIIIKFIMNNEETTSY